MMWKWCCFHLVVSHHGNDIFICENHMETTCDVGSTWKPCGVNMETTWYPFELHMVSTFETMWCWPGNHMMSMWKPWQLHGNNRETTKFVVSRLISSHNPGKPWKSLGFHMKLTSFPSMEMMCKWHCIHPVVSHHGKDIIYTHRNNMTNFKPHSKQVMETMWFPCGHNMVIMWTPHGFHVDTIISTSADEI